MPGARPRPPPREQSWAGRDIDPGGYAGWLDSERIAGNLHRAYAHHGAPGHRADVIAALQEMIADNDGKPLSG